MKTKHMMLCALFTALIAIGAFIKIPMPVMPMTLQFFFTTLAGILLGKRLGTVSVALYVILGLIGVPVFVSGGGPSYIFQPTFGYLIGFVLGTWVTGFVVYKEKRIPSTKRLFFACFLGLIVVYSCGILYYTFITHLLGNGVGLWALMLYSISVDVPGDIVWCFVCVILGKRLIPIIANELELEV